MFIPAALVGEGLAGRAVASSHLTGSAVCRGISTAVAVVLLPLFAALAITFMFDVGDEWRHATRPVGTYTSTVWIPGNFLSEGNKLVNVAVMSHTPLTVLHAREENAVAFQADDNELGDSARGDYIGPMPGVVRPRLTWDTQLNVERDSIGRQARDEV